MLANQGVVMLFKVVFLNKHLHSKDRAQTNKLIKNINKIQVNKQQYLTEKQHNFKN